MEKFIVFNTESQAKNYVKRQKFRSHHEGCGCCFNETGYSVNINTKLVSCYNYGSSQGKFYYNSTVVGRIK